MWTAARWTKTIEILLLVFILLTLLQLFIENSFDVRSAIRNMTENSKSLQNKRNKLLKLLHIVLYTSA